MARRVAIIQATLIPPEIDSATRDGALGTLTFSAKPPDGNDGNFSVLNTVVNGINKKPNNVTLGEGPQTGEEVQIDITFNEPIVLPADHYFFRPEALVASGGDFLYLSAPKPTAPPLFVGDLQAWIRNSDLAPDWLRIGTDIIGGSPAPQFNMTFSLTGETVPAAGTPGAARRRRPRRRHSAERHPRPSLQAIRTRDRYRSVAKP